MNELLYDSQSLACFIIQNEIGTRASMEFIRKVFNEDNEFLHPLYRNHEKELFSDVLYWMDYLYDKVTIDSEFPAIARDFAGSGHTIVKESIISDFSGFDMFFMSMRLNLRFFDSRGYVRIKLRTLLKGYGYQKRSTKLVKYIRDCVTFYRIQSYLRGGEKCDISEIDIDDMITFRLI